VAFLEVFLIALSEPVVVLLEATELLVTTVSACTTGGETTLGSNLSGGTSCREGSCGTESVDETEGVSCV